MRIRWSSRCLAGLLASLGLLDGDGRADEPDSSPAVVRQIQAEGYHLRLDLSRAVMSVDVPIDVEMAERSGQREVAPSKTPAIAGDFVSASILGWKAKVFDDGLYAAVERAAQDGLGQFPGKRRLLTSLANALAANGEPGALGNAPAVIFSAARLGAVEVVVPPTFTADVAATTTSFLNDPVRSLPIGFYTESEPLERIFRQDRMLQTELTGAGGILALARALRGDASLRDTYESYRRLTDRLTNPGVMADLRPVVAMLDDRGHPGGPVPEQGIAVLPPSRSPETELVKRLYGGRPIPEGFSLADQLIRDLRNGSISLEPAADSGWYDRQLHALEPLIRPEAQPEAARLQLSASYLAQLEQLFRGLLTLTRETHIKQLEVPTAGAQASPPIVIEPKLSAEPLPTHYLRRAQAYGYVRNVLEETFGPQALAAVHRQTAAGPVAASLTDELRQMQALCFGAYALTMRELGLVPDADPAIGSGEGVEADIRTFQTWQASLGSDPDLSGDSRTMVPVFYDLQRKQTKVWVLLGWASRPIVFRYATAPPVLDATHNGQPVDPASLDILFEEAHRRIAYPVTAEVYVSKLLDRQDFRDHCDRYQMPSAILKNLR